jgi:hypothetical protein
MSTPPHPAPHHKPREDKPLKLLACKTVPHRLATAGVASVANPLGKDWRHTRQAGALRLKLRAPSGLACGWLGTARSHAHRRLPGIPVRLAAEHPIGNRQSVYMLLPLKDLCSSVPELCPFSGGFNPCH